MPIAPAVAGFTGATPIVGAGQLQRPAAVAVDPSGLNVYVVDTGHDAIQKYGGGLPGGLLLTWGSGGSGPGQLNAPAGIAADGFGHVFVADTGNDRIEEFSSDGVFIASLSGSGAAVGQLHGPTGLAVDGSGTLYVADTGNSRVQRRATDGTWNVVGAASAPRGVAVDAIGLVYVADTGANRVETLASDGTVISSFDGGASPLQAPAGIALDGNGAVFVADTGNDRVVQFSTGGLRRNAWGQTGSAASQFKGPTGVAVSGTDVYVADPGNNRVQQFVPAPAPPPAAPAVIVTFPVPPPPGDFVFGFAVGSGGAFVVFDGDCTAARYDATGTFLGRFGSQGTGDGQFCGSFTSPADFWSPSAAIDPAGNIIVSDQGSKSQRVEVFDPSGGFVRKWVGPGALYALLADGPNRFWATVGSSVGPVDAFDESGAVVGSFQPLGSHGAVAIDPGSGDFVIPAAYDSTAGVYTAIERYDAAGNLLARTAGLAVSSLAFDPAGNLVAINSVTDTLTWLTSTFAPIVSWPSVSSGGLEVDAAGDLYVGGGGTTVTKFGPVQVPAVPPPSFIRALGTASSDGSSRAGFTPQIAVGADGTATAVWDVFDGTQSAVWEATRAAGASTFGTPVPVEPSRTVVRYLESPVVAIAGDGTTTIAWEVDDGAHFAIWQATRAPGAAQFGPPSPVEPSAVSEGDEYPRIAAGPGGATTIVWNVSVGTGSTVWQATRTNAAGAFQPAPVNPGQGVQYDTTWPQVAIGPDDSATITWQGLSAGHYLVWEASRASSAAAFGSPVGVYPVGTIADYALPRVAIDGDGVATITYGRAASGGTSRVWAVTRPAGATSFGAPEQIEPDNLIPVSLRGGNPEAPQVSSGDDGTTTITWQIAEGVAFRVWAATRAAGDLTFGSPVRVDLAPGSITEEDPTVGVGPDGSATISWQVTGGNGTTYDVLAAVRAGPRGSFSPLHLAPAADDYAAPFPQVAAALDGSVTAVWAFASSSAFRTPVSVWQNSTGPILQPPPTTTTTTTTGTASTSTVVASSTTTTTLAMHLPGVVTFAPVGTGRVKTVSISCTLADLAARVGAFCEAAAFVAPAPAATTAGVAAVPVAVPGAPITNVVRKHFNRKGHAHLKLGLDRAGKRLVKRGSLASVVRVTLHDGQGREGTLEQAVTFGKH